ncbi:MAG: hypothetical protein WA915_12100, partial [Candidatus Aminicenantaceae bacterium]
FPSEETSLVSGPPSHLPSGDAPCPPRALLTVFSTTHNWNTQYRKVIYAITDLEMVALSLLKLIFLESFYIITCYILNINQV